MTNNPTQRGFFKKRRDAVIMLVAVLGIIMSMQMIVNDILASDRYQSWKEEMTKEAAKRLNNKEYSKS